MKTNFKSKPLSQVLLIATFAIAAVSCKKENSQSIEDQSTLQAAVADAQAIAVGAVAGAAGDSIYVINTCGARSHRDSISFSALPSSVTSYLTTNYAGYTASKAFTVKDAAGTLQGYIAIITFNGNPVGLKFDASGTFVQVLEQRQGSDLRGGRGWHDGGRFDNRDGRGRDTIVLAALPAAIKTYLSTNYATDTLVRAFASKDGSIVVLSTNNGAFATVFDATGNFIKREQLASRGGECTPIDQSALPANVLSYLTTTYPSYVFNKAFSIKPSGTVTGYVVVIDANNTRYAVEFDATGAFVKVKTIH